MSSNNIPSSPPANIQNYNNNHDWSSAYDTARSNFEQSRHNLGTLANDINSIYTAAGNNPLSKTQAIQLHDDFNAMANESQQNQQLAKTLTDQANSDHNSDELHDANTEIAGENTTINQAIQQVNGLQHNNHLDSAAGGTSGDYQAKQIENDADELTAVANENAQGGAFTSGGTTFQTNTLTDGRHTDVNGATANAPGTQLQYPGNPTIPTTSSDPSIPSTN